MQEPLLALIHTLTGRPILALGAGAFLGLALLVPVLAVLYLANTLILTDVMSLFRIGTRCPQRPSTTFWQKHENAAQGDERATNNKTNTESSEYTSESNRSSTDAKEKQRSSQGSSHRESFTLHGDPFVTLGVSRGSTREEIKRAYKEAMRLYHPDKHSSLPPKLKESAGEITKAINTAYMNLKAWGLAE